VRARKSDHHRERTVLAVLLDEAAGFLSDEVVRLKVPG
jgi:hypothetical protein